MMERTLMALAAAAAIAAAAAVGVIALAFALYAALLPLIGAAWAAWFLRRRISARRKLMLAARVVGLAALMAARKAEGDRRGAAQAPVDSGLVDTLLQVVRDRPIMASGVAVAAGIYALRNPQLIAAVLRAFMDKPSNPRN